MTDRAEVLIGGRLPTDFEWLYAARNAGGEVDFPWGDDGYNGCSHTACGIEPSPACQSPDDVTTQGVCDLAGGVREFAVVEGDGAPALMGVIGGGGGEWVGLGAQNVGEAFALYGRGFRCVR